MNGFRKTFFCGILATLLLATVTEAQKNGKVKGPIYKVHCFPKEMRVEIVKTDDIKSIYLEHLKEYPDPACHPRLEGSKATLSLDLSNIYQCMVTKVLNRITGRRVYYHRVILEREVGPKSVFLVKCDSAANVTSYASEIEELRLSKRSAMPQFDNFREDEEVEITGEVTGHAPIPELIVGVKQNQLLIDDNLTVKPGTPLEMNIELDSTSADIYGVMVSNMEVSDTRQQEEILILNGCTVDPYLFQNFRTDDGDHLRAEFKAFKFPESNVVLFKGTVNVCLDRCEGVECANGQIGYGRRRRRRRRGVPSSSYSNKVYEVSMATVVKVAEEPVAGKPAVQWVERATLSEVDRHPDEAAIAALSEEFGAYKYIDFQQENTAASTTASPLLHLTLSLAMTLLSTVLVCTGRS